MTLDRGRGAAGRGGNCIGELQTHFQVLRIPACMSLFSMTKSLDSSCVGVYLSGSCRLDVVIGELAPTSACA